jgi:hypothetical protein
MPQCPICGSGTRGKNKFCSKECLKMGYRRGMIKNSGLFAKGSVSLNKGRTLESWVGVERAREIKAKMSVNSKAKAVQLKKLNDDPTIISRRILSRKSHDLVVQWLAVHLREKGHMVFTLSEYIKEKRIPDAIVFDGKELIAVEVETEKRWKPSHASTEDRLSRLNGLCQFFDKTRVVFPSSSDLIEETGPKFLDHLLS